MKTTALAAAVLLTLATSALAEVKTQEFEYQQGDTTLQGFIAWDDARKGKRPGVLVVHEWWGHNPHARNQAIRLAEAGYVGLALDMYGKGKVTTHPDDAQAFMQEATKDTALLTARFQAALEVLKKDPHVNPGKVAAIGYCFGGGVVLNMARSGAPLKAVVSFHGSLTPYVTAERGKIKAHVLVLNGADDPMVTAEQIDAFKKEMTAAKAKFEFVNLAGARHSFTNPEADKAGVPGLAYNAEADKQSWEKMLALFKKSLK